MACNAALKLSSLWKKSKHQRVLQQPLTASCVTKHARLLAESFPLASDLQEAIDGFTDKPAPSVDAFLQALLQPYKLAATLGTIMLWLQRSPTVLDFSAILWQPAAVVVEHAEGKMPSAIWVVCFNVLHGLVMTAVASCQEHRHLKPIVEELQGISSYDGGLIMSSAGCQ